MGSSDCHFARCLAIGAGAHVSYFQFARAADERKPAPIASDRLATLEKEVETQGKAINDLQTSEKSLRTDLKTSYDKLSGKDDANLVTTAALEQEIGKIKIVTSNTEMRARHAEACALHHWHKEQSNGYTEGPSFKDNQCS